MKELFERWNKPTPKFWKKVQKNGLAIGVLGGVIVKFNPIIGGVLVTIGSTISALAQLTIEEQMEALMYIGGGLLGIISYFLRKTMEEHKAIQNQVIELKNKIDLTHQASEIKIQNIEKELNTNLRELNKKIDHVTQCIDKLFEITRK